MQYGELEIGHKYIVEYHGKPHQPHDGLPGQRN
jgi:hypothetical protein